MRSLQALLVVVVVSLVPRLAAAACESDTDCANALGAGYTCAESEDGGLGVCYAPCAAGLAACGESSRYCIPEGDICCELEVGPPYGCSPDHRCGEGVTPSCDPLDGGCDDCSVVRDRRGSWPIGALASWGIVALLVLWRRRVRR